VLIRQRRGRSYRVGHARCVGCRQHDEHGQRRRQD
jgi:hypothetical protein